MSGNNEAAFPQPYWDGKAAEDYGRGGMTLRDYFAAKAMAALIQVYERGQSDQKVANRAYEMADAMLIERAKGGGR